MMLATAVVVVALFDLAACSTVTCSYYCTQSVRYTESCGLFGWWQCTRYRTEGSTCYRTGVNGEWGAWSASSVGTCTQTCGSGTRLRSYVRYCNNPAPTDCGSSCPGASTKSESESCNTGCCPVNGGWSSWQLQDTGSCSVTCGGGTQAVTHRRVCNNPTPTCGGVTCSGSSINVVQQSCNMQNCPVNGGWSVWYLENNGSCSAACGGGEVIFTYTRFCDNPAPAYGGIGCVGERTRLETRACNTQPCPIDGRWSSWYLENNGSCSVTCGGGEVNVTYTRYCDNPAPQYGGQECSGDNILSETHSCSTQECPIDGGWSSWYPEFNGSCSVTCGGGEVNVTYRRYCDNPAPQHGGQECSGDNIKSETMSCNTQECPIDGGWSSWYPENSGSCSVTCGGGEVNVTNTRSCDNPAPQYGGQECSGDNIMFETHFCNTQECPINGGWSSWYLENNGSCSVTCGGGYANITYRRECDNPASQYGGQECSGDSIKTETLTCNTQECPIDGGWSSWYLENNGSCSLTCGGGEANVTYTRYCDNPSPQYGGQECSGDNIMFETHSCNTQECPIDGGWSSWYLESNGSCSVTCGGGYANITYRRYCDNPASQYGGQECSGDSIKTEILTCNTQECPIDGGWSSWYLENNGSCSVTCGGGEVNVTYTRSCDNPAPQYGGQECSGDNRMSETHSCNTQECPIDGGWSSWYLENNGTCSVTCGTGVINVTYSRDCDSPAPQNGGADCDGSNTLAETSSCNTEPCPINGNWSSWYPQNNGSCSVTCGIGEMNVTFTRYCDNPTPQYGGLNCTGRKTRIKAVQCNTSPCPVDGNWSEWKAWHDVRECSALCGGGQKTQWRKRACDNPAPAYGGRPCDGVDKENATVVCNQEDCGDLCPENSVSFVSHANNSRLYYQCDNGVALLMSCGKGTAWDQQYNTCVQDSSQQPLNGGDNICVVDGNLPKNDDCTKFYMCAHGIPYEMSCPDGLAFNPVISNCDFYDNVPCRVSN